MLPDENADSAFRILDPRLEPPPPPPPPPDSQFFIGVAFLALRFVGGSSCAGLRGARPEAVTGTPTCIYRTVVCLLRREIRSSTQARSRFVEGEPMDGLTCHGCWHPEDAYRPGEALRPIKACSGSRVKHVLRPPPHLPGVRSGLSLAGTDRDSSRPETLPGVVVGLPCCCLSGVTGLAADAATWEVAGRWGRPLWLGLLHAPSIRSACPLRPI